MFANVFTFLVGKSILLTSNKTIWEKCLQTNTGNALKVQLNIFLEPPTLPRLTCVLNKFKKRLFTSTGHALLK